MQFAKSIFVYVLTTIPTYGFCLAAFLLFDAEPMRAVPISAAITVVLLAFGAFFWPRDKTFLDTFHLARYLLWVLITVMVLLMADAFFNQQQIGSLGDFLKYTRGSMHSWMFLLAAIMFWVLGPYMFASVVRASLIGVMVNVFGATPFGVASDADVEEYRERDRRTSELTSGGEFSAIAMLATWWPGVWALLKIHDGETATGWLVFACWVLAYAGLCAWLHRREVVHVGVSVTCAIAAMLASAYVFWRM